ncbi:hypothetical protein F0562_023246 [Nyssa sinensis]|uniref:HMA domain-containing protein n=1 Tax=Nyssa sinensis TaxID=561372 RepID=A0A5J5BHG1_9ASTE|nr:hypothetical protein F0562_023246 [Nyssa sinensis]
MFVQEGKKPEEGKEEKKDEAKSGKPSEEKKEEKKTEDSKDTKEPPPPPPPQEIVLTVYMHCEGCARKVRRCLKGFEGVENVQTDCRTHKVVVKGEKADPLKVKERVQKKSHRQVELISPIPKPPAEDAKKPEEKETPKPEEKKEEPQVITVVMKVHMHCEACSQEIKKRIQRMKGVENAEPDLKSSQVTVKGVFEPEKLLEYVYKRTGKHAVIVKQEPEKKEEKKPKEGKEEKKEEDGGKDTKKGEEESKDTKEGGKEAAPPPAAAEEESKVVEVKKNDFVYIHPQHYQSYHPQNYQFYPPQNYQHYPPPEFPTETYATYPAYPPHPPQMFSDENPNACSVM